MTIEGVRRVVAVKVRHPGVADIIRRDFQVLIKVATSCYMAVTYHWEVLSALRCVTVKDCSIHKPYRDGCTTQVALKRPGLFCRYLAHHEPESIVSFYQLFNLLICSIYLFIYVYIYLFVYL